ncbi:hypothetical protein B0H14DRAFT_3879173 [Mycena olivaceomarginata]|nr:hypothetical protein B0H14DRAFT_3879173 [Mycena olivaceomarginata]
MTCGISWKRLPYSKQCGTCHEQELAAAGIINHGLDVAKQARSAVFALRTHRPQKPNALAANSPQPTIELNTAALNQFRNVGYSDADCVKLYAEARLDTNSKINMRLGQTSRSYPPDTSMDRVPFLCSLNLVLIVLFLEIKDELLAGWNVTWTKAKTYPIVKERADWRFHGNQNIIQDSEHLAVLDFYQAHKNSGVQDAYFTKMPKHAAAMKGCVMALELWIDTPEDDTSPPPGSVAKKRRGSAPPKENEDPAAKRPRVSGVGSNFKRKVPGPDPANSTEISLSSAELLVNKETCEVAITWPAIDPDTTEAALIGDEISHSGKMKHCFKLSIGTEQYVAKHFYEIGSGQDEVTMVENAANLQFEALRCETARWFLNRFRSATDDLNMTIAKNFEITKCRLAQEVIPLDGAPSPASGVVKEVFEAELEATHRIVGFWSLCATPPLLITPGQWTTRRWSEGTIVFADIQGSSGRLSTKVMGIIIFDMMTHTTDGDSGVGDYGEKGIEKWRDQHDCNVFCKNLDLAVGDDDEDD